MSSSTSSKRNGIQFWGRMRSGSAMRIPGITRLLQPGLGRRISAAGMKPAFFSIRVRRKLWNHHAPLPPGRDRHFPCCYGGIDFRWLAVGQPRLVVAVSVRGQLGSEVSILWLDHRHIQDSWTNWTEARSAPDLAQRKWSPSIPPPEVRDNGCRKHSTCNLAELISQIRSFTLPTYLQKWTLKSGALTGWSGPIGGSLQSAACCDAKLLCWHPRPHCEAGDPAANDNDDNEWGVTLERFKWWKTNFPTEQICADSVFAS
jgi:hypothetical protein